MRKILIALVALVAIGSVAYADKHPNPGQGEDHPIPTLISFGKMYGVAGPFLLEKNAIRGIIGDEDPWEVRSARGRLDIEGNLTIHVRGLVFAEGAPPEKVGINDEDTFRGAVSCLTEASETAVGKVKVFTKGFPATATGDSDIEAHVDLPNPCIAPIVFVLAGSEDKWFAVNGFESDEGD